MPDTAPIGPLNWINHALALLGEDALTDLLATSGSTNAAAATIYDRTVETLLCDWPWRFAIRDLACSQITADPPEPWLYQFNLPARTIRVISTDRPGEEYAIFANHDVSDTVGTKRLYAMRTGVRARVLIRPLDEVMPAHFVAALIPRLAAELAMPVTGNPNVAAYYKGEADQALRRAKLIDASEMPTRVAPEQADPRETIMDGSVRDWFPFHNF